MQSRKNILLITYYFPPSGGAGVQRWLKMLKYLAKAGHNIHVLTVDEQYASYPQWDAALVNEIPKEITLHKTKTKEILSFYKKLSPNKEIPYSGFVNEKKVGVFEKIARAIRGNFFLPDPRRGWNRYAIKEAKVIIEEANIDTLITTSPPHSSQLIGLKLKKHYPQLTWIVDLRDPWTDIYYNQDLYQTAIAKKINALYEKQVLQKADKIITVSESLVKLFNTKTPIADKATVVYNGFDAADFEIIHPINNKGQFVISYIGMYNTQYETDTFCAAIKALPSKIQKQLLLRFVGVVNEEAKKQFLSLGVNTEFIDYVPHSEAVRYMLSSDILLLVIPNIKDNAGILTGKLFEYIASKKPILLIGPRDGEAKQIIEQGQLGKSIVYADSQAASQFIAQVYDKNCALKPSKEIANAFSRENQTRRLIQLL